MATKSVIIRLDAHQDALLKAMVKASGKNQQQFCIEQVFASAAVDSSVLSEVVKSQQETIRQQQETITMLSQQLIDSRQQADATKFLAKNDISYLTKAVCVEKADPSTSQELPKYKVGQKIRGDEVEMLLLNPNILKQDKRVLVDGCIWLIGRTANYAHRTATLCQIVPQAVLDRLKIRTDNRFHSSTTILDVLNTLEQYQQYLDFLKQPGVNQLSSDTMDKLSRSWDWDKYSWEDALRKATVDLEQLRNNPQANQEDILEARQDDSEALSDASESTLEVSGDVSEVIPDAPESTLEDIPTLPDATQEETLTRDEFMAKWDMRTDTVEGNQAYSKAYDKTKDGGFWTAPDGSTWTRTGEKKKALWTHKTPATA